MQRNAPESQHGAGKNSPPLASIFGEWVFNQTLRPLRSAGEQSGNALSAGRSAGAKCNGDCLFGLDRAAIEQGRRISPLANCAYRCGSKRLRTTDSLDVDHLSVFSHGGEYFNDGNFVASEFSWILRVDMEDESTGLQSFWLLRRFCDRFAQHKHRGLRADCYRRGRADRRFRSGKPKWLSSATCGSH